MLSQFHTASAITVDFNCRTPLRPLTRVLTIRASRTLSKLNLKLNVRLVRSLNSFWTQKFFSDNTSPRFRHDVAVYNTLRSCASLYRRRTLYDAPKNTAAAVYTTRGLKKIKCGWNSRLHLVCTPKWWKQKSMICSIWSALDCVYTISQGRRHTATALQLHPASGY